MAPLESHHAAMEIQLHRSEIGVLKKTRYMYNSYRKTRGPLMMKAREDHQKYSQKCLYFCVLRLRNSVERIIKKLLPNMVLQKRFRPIFWRPQGQNSITKAAQQLQRKKQKSMTITKLSFSKRGCTKQICFCLLQMHGDLDLLSDSDLYYRFFVYFQKHLQFQSNLYHAQRSYQQKTSTSTFWKLKKKEEKKAICFRNGNQNQASRQFFYAKVSGVFARPEKRKPMNSEFEGENSKRAEKNIFLNCYFYICQVWQIIQDQFEREKMQSGLQRSVKMQEQEGRRLKVEIDCQQGEQKGNESESLDQDGGTLGRKWSLEQNIHFIMFMDYYKVIFKCKSKRKSTKIYKKLAEVLPNRTSRQCRSRYQKIMKTFKNFTRAKKHYLSEWGDQSYDKEFQLFSNSLATNSKLKKINQEHIWNFQLRTTKETQKCVIPAQNNQAQENKAEENFDNQYFFMANQTWYPQGWYFYYASPNTNT